MTVSASASAGVWGEAPAHLDTQRENAPHERDAFEDFAPRRAFPPSAWERKAWRRQCAAELHGHGRIDEAFSLGACGRRGWSRDCHACGETDASVVVYASCGSRLCDWCARMRAQRLARRLEKAMGWIDGHSIDARTAATARAECDRDRARCRSPHRAMRAARWWHDLRDVNAWRWRALTFAVPWDPSDPDAYSVDALRERLRLLWRQWRHVWEWRLSVKGLASASVHAEISTGGHVHLHVLYHGPWVSSASLTSMLVDQWGDTSVGRAWVGAVYGARGDAATEAAKYITKGSGPSSAAWVAGAPRLALNPRVAAAWVVAQSSAQLARHYGRLRLALAATRTRDDDRAVPPLTCCRCAAEFPEVGGAGWRHDWADAIARRVRDGWAKRLRVRRWSPVGAPEMSEATARIPAAVKRAATVGCVNR